MLDAKIELLQRLPVFQGLSRAQLSAIVRIAKKAFFEEGEKIISENESGETSYLIVTGAATCPKLVNGHSIDQHLGPGTLIGELAMISETVHNFSVTAKERVRAMAIERNALRDVMAADPIIAEHISKYLIHRLRELAGALRSMDMQLTGLEKLDEVELPNMDAEKFTLPSMSALYGKESSSLDMKLTWRGLK